MSGSRSRDRLFSPWPRLRTIESTRYVGSRARGKGQTEGTGSRPAWLHAQQGHKQMNERMGNGTFLAWLTAGNYSTAWNTPVTCHSDTSHQNDVFFLSSFLSFLEGVEGSTQRSEGNLGTTKIALRGLALRMLEKQTDCWLGCGHETPNFRKAGWAGSAVRAQPTGDTLRPGREADHPFPVLPLFHCPTATKKGWLLFGFLPPSPSVSSAGKGGPCFSEPTPGTKCQVHKSPVSRDRRCDSIIILRVP